MKKKDYPFQQSTRGPLLPFDEIVLPDGENRRERNLQALIAYLPSIIAESKDYKHQQQEKLMYLQKINDPSYEKPSLKQTLMDVIDFSLSKRLKIFNPSQTLILLWNMLMLGAIIFNFLQIPLSLFLTDQVYEFQKQNPYLFSINAFFICILFIDTFFIRFNLAFYRHGKFIAVRSEIVWGYLISCFFLDLIAWLVYLFYISLNDARVIYLKLFFYLKLPQLLRINQQIVEKLSQSTARYCIYCVIRMILLLWFITTWVSSIYFAIDFHYYNEKGYYFETGQLWLTNSNTVNNINIIQVFPRWYYWYEFAVYWSFQTSATVGYGDITPRNPTEVLYCNFIILVNTVFFAFYINTIWEIISELQQYTERYTKNWENLRQFIRNKDISEQFKLKIGNYLQEKWIHESEDIVLDEQQQFIEDLSEQLKVELYIGMKGRILKSCFGQYYRQHRLQHHWSELIKHLVLGVEQETIGSSTQIYAYGDLSDKLHYLVKGKLSLSVDQLGIGEFFHLPTLFGQRQFVTHSCRKQTAVTESLCSFETIDYGFFVNILKIEQKLYQKFCELKENITMNKQISLWSFLCLKCCSKSHNYKNCPELNKWRNCITNPLYGYRKLRRPENMERKRIQRKEVNSKKLKQLKLSEQIHSVDEVKSFASYRESFNFY